VNLVTTEHWQTHIRNTLQRYDEALLRKVAHKLCKPRNQWPFDELLDRVLSALQNAAMIDRCLKELPPASRQILAVMGHSRQPRWTLGALIEILVMLGQSDGLPPLLALLESGLLLPLLFAPGTDEEQGKPSQRSKLRGFEPWLLRTEPPPMLLAAPLVTQRALGEDLGIVCPGATPGPQGGKASAIHEADGLDWPLRLAVLWQQTLGAPLRRTQQGDFFKRDLEKLQNDPLCSAPPIDTLETIPDPGFLGVALAAASGLLRESETEFEAGEFSAAWKGPLSGLLSELWIALPHVRTWNPAQGHALTTSPGQPYASACMMALLLLTRLPSDAWTAPQAIEDWIAARHPFWQGQKAGAPAIARFLLGIAYSLRLVQAVKDTDGSWLIRLSALGRWAMNDNTEQPIIPGFKQTLLVQPNLEMLAYRQGLTPELIVSLSKVATWKGLGPACTLQLEPHSVYRALEMGESLTSIVQLLEGHGMKAMPPAVVDSLKTWASKRERISIYPAGAIFEFASAAEMNEALARGLPAVRLTDRLAIVADESAIEYKHFRLTGTRDYTLPPERCVDVESDGVTLNVDLARSDLLLETELQRFAVLLQRPAGPGRRLYQLTPTSIASARDQGITLSYLETWFQQRTGTSVSPAARLLMAGPDAVPLELQPRLILYTGSEEVADGLQQWPDTRNLISARLGPSALVVEEENVRALTERLNELGLKTRFENIDN
jgi:hypothetical protein